MSTNPQPADDSATRLNAIGVINRREIEARIVGPLLEALGDEFGRERVLEIARDTIVHIAQEQGAQLAEALGGNSFEHLNDSMVYWKANGALEIEVIEQTDETFGFNVRRCRYAEMYRSLGLGDLGGLLSCNRDFAMVEGFNPDVKLTRTQTIMQGAPYCDFRYRLAKQDAELPN